MVANSRRLPWMFIGATKQSLIGVGVYLQQGYGDLDVADEHRVTCTILEIGSADR